jgi:hypothetical protein
MCDYYSKNRMVIRYMPTHQVVIDCVNRSDMPDVQFEAIIAACQQQFNDSVSREWDCPVTLAMSKLETVPADSWEFLLFNNTDQAGAAGYHMRAPNGQPSGKAFYKTDLAHNLTPSVTIAHELIEMAIDPDINRVVLVSYRGGIRLFAQEGCDAIEHEQFSPYVSGIKLSAFVTRGWFIPGYTGQMDSANVLTNPFEIAPGGYIAYFDIMPGRPPSGWQILQQQGHRHSYSPRREARFSEVPSI